MRLADNFCAQQTVCNATEGGHIELVLMLFSLLNKSRQVLMHGVCSGSPREQPQLLHCKEFWQKVAGAGIDLGIIPIFAEPKL